MRYIILLLLLVSCGARKVHKDDIKKTDEHVVEKKIIDTSNVSIDKFINTKIVDTSTNCDIEVKPIDTTKPFIYDGKVVKNAVLRIKKHKNNITTQTNEKVSEKRHNAVITTVNDKSKTEIKVSNKDVDRKQSYWWLLLIAIAYIAYRVYDKNKYI